MIQQYQYDARYRLTGIDHLTPFRAMQPNQGLDHTAERSLTSIGHQHYEYDPAGRLISSHLNHLGQVTYTFEHDDLYRVVRY